MTFVVATGGMILALIGLTLLVADVRSWLAAVIVGATLFVAVAVAIAVDFADTP